MKRLASSDSFGGVISICPSTDEKNTNLIYSRGFQSMLDGLVDDEDCLEESCQISEKKRRLSVDQVKALEKNFEVENKLEPERKVKLAQELGLQPRQVAVWFQNRRARCKTKQLEKDYSILKASYDALKQSFEALQHDKEALLTELKGLKSNRGEETPESNTNISISIKEEMLIPESENKASDDNMISTMKFNNGGEASLSDYSDSSGILNEDTSLNSSSGACQEQEVLISPSTSSLRFDCFSAEAEKDYHPHQFVKMEEHNFFGSDEHCNFFSEEDQAPTLQWYCPDQWN